MELIDFTRLERKWQKKWAAEKIFEAKESKKEKYYIMEMYPYPSGAGLHMGHASNYTIGDIKARLKRMQGYNVIYPMGFDSFGLPAENAAIKAKSHPKKFTDDAIKNYISQMKNLGFSYDWSRKIESHSPDYYKWDQWIFLKMFEKGLAYRKKSPVNFCKDCNTVLANEQVVGGKCWRHEDTDVEVRQLEQWFFKITDYAEELYDSLDKLEEWPQEIKKMQKNWIGKSVGTEIDFEIKGQDKKWKVFTTRPDTLFGVTFLVVSAQHPDLMQLVTKEKKAEVEKFVKKIKGVSEENLASLEKEGVFTGSYAVHPLTNEKIPIWAGNFVLADYGSGMVMAVPAHDQRDYDFAKKYNLQIKEVITPVTGIERDNEEFRKSIVAIVENPEDGKVLSINWGNQLGGNLFVGGGVEDEEDEVECAKREIAEETGYKNIELVSKTSKIIHHYIAHSKNVNRQIEATGLLFRLKGKEKIKQNLEESEKGKFSVEWITKEEASKKVKDELHNLIFRKLILGEAYSGPGKLINSEGFTGLPSSEAKEHITIALNEKGVGKKVTKFRLKDWLISRQRFWGTPIPIVYCEDCGIVPVNEKDLPVKLPDEIKFEGVENPLKSFDKFTKTKCPSCNKPARRETDTMDTFVNSSWYFFRYLDPQNDKKIFDKKKADYWMPIDTYIGGREHACLHLIYCRFYTKFLRDLGLTDIDEPIKRLFNQGMLHASDGRKMSKSYGNVIVPETISEKYGTDAARMFLVSVASPDKDFNWSDEGVEGASRFILRVINFVNNFKSQENSELLESKLNRIIRDYTSDLENFRYNIAVIKLRELFESLEAGCDRKSLEAFLKLLNPVCPHVTEELWSKLGNKSFISIESWPKFDEKKINAKLEEAHKQAAKITDDIQNIIKILKEKQNKTAEKVFVYVIPNEKQNYNEEEISRKISLPVKVYAVNDKDKHDPENKASKAKPGKPGIYVE